MSVAVVGKEVEYEGAFDREKVMQAVRRLGLGLKDRASLYLRAADLCQDDEVSEILMELAEGYAERSSRIDEVRQRFDIPLTPIGDVNMLVNSRYPAKGNDRPLAMPPSTVERFHPQLSVAVTKEVCEHMVRALEGKFVPFNRGEAALRAFGLLPGEVTCYVDWLDGLLSLTATTLFLLGRVRFVLYEEEVVNGCLLPAGSYGNGTAIVATRQGGAGHWQTVAALFRDAHGEELKSGSLRTTAARIPSIEGREFRNIIYLFRPLLFDSNGNPRQNSFFSSGGQCRGSQVG